MSTAKDLGTRHVCWKCEAKFYDLNRPSPACPKCGADPRERPMPKVVAKPAKAAAPAAPKPADERAEDDDLDEESFDDLDEDTEEDDDEDDDLY